MTSLEKWLEVVRREIDSLSTYENDARVKSILEKEGKHVEVLNLGNEEWQILEETVTETQVNITCYVRQQT